MTTEGKGHLSRRAAVGTMAAAGLGFAVFGPRQAQDVPPGRTVVDYWEKWTGQEAAAMRLVVDRFNRSQDRIWVRYFSMSAIDQKTTIAIAGGDPPDLVGLWNFSLPAFVEADAVLDLKQLDAEFGAEIATAFRSRYGDADHRLRRERYAPQVWDMCEWKGQLGGISSACTNMGLYYDKAAFRAVGLDPEKPPRTIAELDSAAEKLTTYKPDGSIDRAGFIHREPGWWNWLWGYHFGGALLDPATGDATAASAENIAAYDWLQTYPEKFGTARLVAFQSGFGGYNSVQQPILAGKVAMVFQGSFIANVFKTFAPDFEYGAAPFPVIDELYDPDRPIGLMEADVLCIPKGAKHPREAYEFVMFTQRREQVELLASRHAKPTTLRTATDEFVRDHPNKFIAMHNKLAVSAGAFPKPQTRVWPQYEAEFNSKIGSMWERTETATEALTQIQERGQAQIARMRDVTQRRYGDRA